MLFLNDTLLVLMYTANMMANLPNETESQKSGEIEDKLQNVTTTTLSPEEEANKFDFEDGRKTSFSKNLSIFLTLKNWKRYLSLKRVLKFFNITFKEKILSYKIDSIG